MTVFFFNIAKVNSENRLLSEHFTFRESNNHCLEVLETLQ